jgi:hypothetical protein
VVSTQPPDDGEREALLARDGRLARAWREASREEPPAALDDAVRAAARRAVHAGPRVGHGPFGGRWRVPLSIAAVLVVSATLTLLVAERREHVPSAGLDAAPAAPPAVAPEPHAPAKDAAPSGGNAASPRKQSADEPAQPLRESRTELYDAPAEAGGTIAQDAAPEARGLQSAPAPPTAGAQRARDAAPLRTYEESAAPGAVAPAADVQVGENETGEVKKEGPQAFPEPEQARADTRTKSRMEADAVEMGKRESAQGDEAATPSAAQQAEPLLDPKAWLERILALRREGKLQQADRSLQEFRRRHPDYPLPPELARLPSASAPADSR